MKNDHIVRALLIGLNLSLFVGPALAQTCPELPDRVNTRVKANVKFDSASSLYTYTYSVTNDVTSAQEIDSFAVEIVGSVSNAMSALGWVSTEYTGRSVIGWNAFDVADPYGIPNDASLPPSIAQIKLGSSLGGFSFQSAKPPGPARYYVTGFVPLAGSTAADEATAELNAEQLVETCSHLRMHILDQAKLGNTLGPVDATAVRIDVKPGSDQNPINPNNRGVVPVAILGSPTFDVAQVDVSSVRLGPGQAAPRSGAHVEDVNGDGVIDLLFQFPTQEIGLLCGDTSLFLMGRLLDGTAVVGVDSVVTVPCKP